MSARSGGFDGVSGSIRCKIFRFGMFGMAVFYIPFLFYLFCLCAALDCAGVNFSNVL